MCRQDRRIQLMYIPDQFREERFEVLHAFVALLTMLITVCGTSKS
jgi:hypothetical protein